MPQEAPLTVLCKEKGAVKQQPRTSFSFSESGFSQSTTVFRKIESKDDLIVTIHADADQLKETADTMIRIADMLNTNMEHIESLVVNLGFEWQGQAAAAYTAKILIVKKQFEALYGFLTDSSEVIRLIADEYEENEKNLITQMEV